MFVYGDLMIFHGVFLARHRIVRGVISSFLGLCVVLGVSSDGWGHGVLIESSPPHGAVLEEAPTSISLRFNSALEPSITQVILVDMKQQKQPLKIAEVSTIERVIATVPPLPPGVYHVNYQVLATDGHVTEGSIRFTILAH